MSDHREVIHALLEITPEQTPLTYAWLGEHQHEPGAVARLGGFIAEITAATIRQMKVYPEGPDNINYGASMWSIQHPERVMNEGQSAHLRAIDEKIIEAWRAGNVVMVAVFNMEIGLYCEQQALAP